MPVLKAKNAPKSNFSWRCAQNLLGELTAFPRPLAGFKGPTSVLREGSGKERMGRDGSGRKGRGGTAVLWSPKTSLKYTLFKGVIPQPRAKSAVYDCLVPFDDKSMETSLYKESGYAKIINYSAWSYKASAQGRLRIRGAFNK